MKTITTICVILITPLTLIGQSQKVYVYDFDTEFLDSFSVIFDSTVQEAQTNHCVGYYNNNIVDLPINPLISGSISPRQPLDLDYNISDFPFRTTVKIFSNVDYSSEPMECTGQMVSGRHVLTGFFCVAAFIDNNLTLNAVTVCPNYNNIENDEFGCISVQKMYFFSIKEFGLDRFFCLLELEAPVGQKTGWLGTGFSQNATFYESNIFYRFTYPDSLSYAADSYLYDGERLYYQYGVPKFTNTRNIVFPNSFNTNGEGGGNLILTNNNMDYISFGIATYVVGTRHSLMSNGIFYAINEVIKNDLFKTNKPRRKIRIAPNPSNDMISIIGLLPTEFVRIDIYDDLGKLMGTYEEINLESRISVEDWPPGTYHTYLYGINYHAHLKFIRF